MKDAKCTAVYGRRGSGKSTLVKGLIRHCRRLVVFDPMGEYARLPGFRGAATVREIQAGLARAWDRGFRLALVPERNHEMALHALSDLLWKVQVQYDAGRDDRKITLVVEEMNLGFPNRPTRPGRDAFQRLILQGRHRGIEIIGVTQRPALVSPNFRSNTAESYFFALEDEADINIVMRKIGRARAAEYRALPNHTYLHVAGGQVIKGRNRLRSVG
jgi:hypothetical protein